MTERRIACLLADRESMADDRYPFIISTVSMKAIPSQWMSEREKIERELDIEFPGVNREDIEPIKRMAILELLGLIFRKGER